MTAEQPNISFLMRCSERLQAWDPPVPNGRLPIALTLSGGGFRATFAAMGVIRYLADAGRLGDVRLVSSVSGGSIANAMLALAWPKLREEGFSSLAVDRYVIEPVRTKVAEESFGLHLARNFWKAFGNQTRTEVLATELADWFIGDASMDSLDDQVRWVINGANLGTGTRFTFERDRIGDYVNGFAPMPSSVSVATAVAASAAVPGPFSPLSFDDLHLPCRDQYLDSVSVMDGGIYDNTGIELIDGNSGKNSRYNEYFSISSVVGGVLEVGPFTGVPILRDLLRSNSVLYRQSRNLRTRDLLRQIIAGERSGCVFKLDTTIPDRYADRPALQAFKQKYPEGSTHNGTHLALVRTSFDRFDRPLSGALIRRCWWLTGALVATFFPDEMSLPNAAVLPE